MTVTTFARVAPLLLGLPTIVLSATGCDVPPVESAGIGALPPVQLPMGVAPGPGKYEETVTSPYAQDPVALMQGRKLFVWYNCAGCHGGHGGGGMGPSLRDREWLYGESDGHIFASIAEGRRYGMPAWGLKLPEEQIWKMVSYIDSLGTDYEPKPPIVTQPKVHIPPRLKSGTASTSTVEDGHMVESHSPQERPVPAAPADEDTHAADPAPAQEDPSAEREP